MSITEQTVAYRDLDVPLTGLLYRDPELGSRPGILLIHGGAGLDEHARDQACRYAGLGYTVLACDMFGEGVAGDRERIIACVTRLRDDPASLVRRGQAGLTALAGCAGTDGRFAAVGFCFGGMAALALARSGQDGPGERDSRGSQDRPGGRDGPGGRGGHGGQRLAGVVSMHGSLATTAPAQPGRVHAKVLACHGALDPHVPMADVTAFAEEMGHAGADWQVIMYGGAQHGFTHKHAVPGAIPGVAYDELADSRSFEAARTFLAEIFASD